MTSGNKLYRIDLGRGRAIELYTYETDPSAQIVSFKFKDPESVREEDDDEEIGEYKEKTRYVSRGWVSILLTKV